MDTRVHERLLDAVAIDRDSGVVGVLLDNREQVREQFALERRQIVTAYLRPRLTAADAVDARARGDRRRRRRSVAPRTAGAGLGAADRAAQALRGWFALLRYRRPSSYRWA
jgi:hypothetical protein